MTWRYITTGVCYKIIGPLADRQLNDVAVVANRGRNDCPIGQILDLIR